MIGETLYFEDVKHGDELPQFEELMTTVEMARYGAATWDFSRVHFDKEFVDNIGFPKPFVDGQMLGSYMARLAGEWAGDPCSIRKMNVRYTQMLFPGDTIVCTGKVERTYTEDERNLAECELTIEKKSDRSTAAFGRVIVELPTRSQV